MSFWDVTKRMMQGKPAFEVSDTDDGWQDDADAPTIEYAEERAQKRSEHTTAASPETGLYDAHGVKHIPVVSTIAVRFDNHGANIDLWATIKNQSARGVELDKIALLGTHFGLHYPLAPGAQHDFKIYSGPQITHGNYKKAELYYKDTQSGDYFRADHLIEYKYETDKTYDVNGLRLLMPIHDI